MKKFKEFVNEIKNTKIKARLIHNTLKKNQLPTKWTYPNQGEFEGAQVLSVSKALDIAINGDNRDDWYNDNYSHIAFLKVSGLNGDSGPLKYRAIVEDDLIEMRVISLSNIDQIFLDIALEHEDNEKVWNNFNMPNTNYIIDEYEDEIIKKAKPVKPDFVNTI